MLKAIFAQKNKNACLKQAEEVAQKLQNTKLRAAANTLRHGIQETLTYINFPHEHWLRIRSNNGIERINREMRRRQEHADAGLCKTSPRRRKLGNILKTRRFHRLIQCTLRAADHQGQAASRWLSDATSYGGSGNLRITQLHL